jgi:hypothetical protein
MSRSPGLASLFFVGEVAASVVEWRAVVVRLGMDGVNADAVVMRLMDAIVEKTFMVLQTCTINGINAMVHSLVW